MSTPSVEDRIKALRETFTEHGQEHVFRFLDEGKLSDDETLVLIEALEKIDCAQVNRDFASLNDKSGDTKQATITPFTDTTVKNNATDAERKAWRDKGLSLIAENKVAVLLMAGGQGTRLGSSDPKGCYDIGLPSGKSLFQLQAERIIKLKSIAAQHAGVSDQKFVSLPFMLMTSEFTHQPTMDFFKANSFFGLPEEDVMFFQQGTYPCLDEHGKFMMATTYKPATAPDGNGGVYKGIVGSGVLEKIIDRGFEYVHFFGVDNALVKVADPYYIGFSVLSNSNCSNKVVLKNSPKEKVGVMVLKNGKPEIVEYSEITDEMAEQRNDDGMLVYSAANIVNHFFHVDFIRTMASASLPLHVAHKKIPYVDNNGLVIKPKQPNGIKIEKFVFDVFPDATNMVCFAVDRDEEFSPVKNKDGSSSPQTARQDVSNYHKKLLQAAGANFSSKGADDTKQEQLVEISPLVSYDGEDLNELVEGKEIETPYLLSASSESNKIDHKL